MRLPDGRIVFKGRIDEQIKIRGFRIELAEIEARLNDHRLIKESVVIARGYGEEKYLAAYYVAEEEMSEEEIRGYLKNKLPIYIIPDRFVQLKTLPLTPNGKVDRRSLPEPEIRKGQDYVAPSNGVEEQLVEIWAEILKIDKERISVNKSFFELGGNSIKVVRLNVVICERLGWNLSTVDMFRYPTISSLAGFARTGEPDHEQYAHATMNELAGMRGLLSGLEEKSS
jgi:acyl carrier protein